MMAPLEDLTAALNLVREELDRLIREARDEGAEAYRKGDTSAFARADDLRQRLEAFAERFGALCKEWQASQGGSRPRRPNRRAAIQRAHTGEVLHEKEYVFPILQILQEAGGALVKAEVVSRLEKRLGQQLGPADLEPLSRGEVRWQNRAAWVRNDLADAGLLRRGGPRGVWEITEEGRQELARGDLEATWRRVTQVRHRQRRGEG